MSLKSALNKTFQRPIVVVAILGLHVVMKLRKQSQDDYIVRYIVLHVCFKATARDGLGKSRAMSSSKWKTLQMTLR